MICFWTVAGVVGHVGDVAMNAGVDAGVVEEVGFVAASGVAAGAVSRAQTLEAGLVAGHAEGLVLSNVCCASGWSVVAQNVHSAVGVGGLRTG